MEALLPAPTEACVTMTRKQGSGQWLPSLSSPHPPDAGQPGQPGAGGWELLPGPREDLGVAEGWGGA